MSKLKELYYDVKYFIINTFKFRHLLTHYREYSGGWALEQFLRTHIKQCLLFYAEPKNCMQIDESREQILSELWTAYDMLESAFDDGYYLRELPPEAYDLDDMFEPIEGTNYSRLKSHDWDWTKEEMDEANAKYLIARKEFFDYLEQHYLNWWD